MIFGIIKWNPSREILFLWYTNFAAWKSHSLKTERQNQIFGRKTIYVILFPWLISTKCFHIWYENLRISLYIIHKVDFQSSRISFWQSFVSFSVNLFSWCTSIEIHNAYSNRTYYTSIKSKFCLASNSCTTICLQLFSFDLLCNMR